MMQLAAFAAISCLAVNPGSDQILAGDLAAALPGLIVPAPGIPVALAPSPGVQRVFRAPELRRMAERFGWSGVPDADICVERPVFPPDPARFLAAMRKAMPEAEITLLEYGRQSLPEGELEFPASGVHPGPMGALWSGNVRYAGTHRFSVWARVKILVPVTQLIAVVDLEPGHEIAADQVHAETGPGFPPAVPVLTSGEGAIGKWPRATIHAGTAIRAAMLQDPMAVVRGDTVKLDVSSGAAHLELDVLAEGSGAVGETISVLNLDSHRHIPARVVGKGRVSVGIPAVRVNP
jgi:flagella basal body P-ring formation protein FlgA